MNPLVQPVPSFARTTRSMTSHNLAGQTSRASHAAASAASRPAARRPEAGKLNGRWDPGPAVASTSRAAAGSRPAASSIKGKERATTSASHHASPNGSGRPRKSARRSKEDGDAVARFLPGPAAALSPPVGPKAPAGRRPPRARSFGSSSLTSLASTTAPNNENVPFLAEPEDEGSDDDLNIQPSPRKKQPPPLRLGSTPPPSPTGSRAADPPLSPSRRANPGVKRSRARAFDEGHLSPPKHLRLETPRVPLQLDASNPFYVSPQVTAPRRATTPPPSLPPLPVAGDEMDVFLPSSSSGPPPSSLEILRLPSPPPVPGASKKRPRGDSPAGTPLKSCLSSSPLRAAHSSERDAGSSAGTTPHKKSKRVKLTPPGPETPSAAASYRIDDPARTTSPVADPSVSPKRMPPVVDLRVLAKKFKSPRKKVVKRDDVDDGEGALGIRDFLVALPPEPADDIDVPAAAAQKVSASGLPQLATFTGVPSFKLSTATPSRLPQPTGPNSIPRPRSAVRGGVAAPTLSSLAKATPKVPTKTLSSISKPPSLAGAPSQVPPAPRTRPLYPASLSSRPAAPRPLAPLPSVRKASAPLPPSSATARPTSPRTVSAPILGQGLSAEGRTAMKGLAESLAKLNVRRSTGGEDKTRRSTGGAGDVVSRPSLPGPPAAASLVPASDVTMGPPSLPVSGRRLSGLPVSRRVSANSSAAANTSADGVEGGPSVSLTDSKSRASLASIAADAPACTTLKGVVAFVDVKTAEGDEAGGVFVEMLRNLGAKVRP